MKRATGTILALVLLLAGFALAQSPNPVVVTQKVFKVVTENGSEQLRETTQSLVKPGDVLEYHIVCLNSSTGSVQDLKCELPIPAGSVYVTGSASPAHAEASADGVNFSSLPLKKVVVRNGVTVEEVLPLSAYRSLRWKVAVLRPGASMTAKARVRVK